MDKTEIRETITRGNTFLGIELGSTRIKAVLTGPGCAPIASGDFGWENRYENGFWTYHMDEVWSGLHAAFAALAKDVKARYGVVINTVAAMGVSGMMHGYLPLSGEGEPLCAFRTWRNTTTGAAAAELTRELEFNIPQRWSIAHLYQAILNGEEHVAEIACLTTLAGYVHLKLTGEQVLGVGEASGVFPIDSATCDYDAAMIARLDTLTAGRGYPWKLRDILPRVLSAGAAAGTLTEAGARLLDPTGSLRPGILLCPPEGDAGTGMTATNAVAVHTGNVSAGTSAFAMIVLEQALSKAYPEIDMVTTPAGAPVAMVHCNNCTNEINAWAEVFSGFLTALGQKPDSSAIFTAMFRAALAGEADGGGLLLYNYLSGEPITGLKEGRPLLARAPDGKLTFPNFMRVQLWSALATLRLGMDILTGEGVAVNRLWGHGGFFKTPEVGQRMMAAALGVPISVMETAGEGGPWGMALLAAYCAVRSPGESLEDFLQKQVFTGQKAATLLPTPEDTAGFAAFLDRYKRGLAVERVAAEHLETRNMTGGHSS